MFEHSPEMRALCGLHSINICELQNGFFEKYSCEYYENIVIKTPTKVSLILYTHCSLISRIANVSHFIFPFVMQIMKVSEKIYIRSTMTGNMRKDQMNPIQYSEIFHY